MEERRTGKGYSSNDRILHSSKANNLPLVAPLLASSQLWDWDKNFQNTQIFEGHNHYVMMAKFNPKDTNTFATASLDRSIKVWGLSSPTPHYSLEGHERGVNCIDYYPSGDKVRLDKQAKRQQKRYTTHSHN